MSKEADYRICKKTEPKISEEAKKSENVRKLSLEYSLCKNAESEICMEAEPEVLRKIKHGEYMENAYIQYSK